MIPQNESSQREPTPKQLPKIDLITFILSVSSAAYMGLGLVAPPGSASPTIDLDLARQNIDLLELIFEKTRGNRTPEEDRLLEQLLFETRMKFVEVQNKQSQKG